MAENKNVGKLDVTYGVLQPGDFIPPSAPELVWRPGDPPILPPIPDSHYPPGAINLAPLWISVTSSRRRRLWLKLLRIFGLGDE
jgi:hypothetical protein